MSVISCDDECAQNHTQKKRENRNKINTQQTAECGAREWDEDVDESLERKTKKKQKQKAEYVNARTLK